MATGTESMLLSAWHAENITPSALLLVYAESISLEYYSQHALRVILSAYPESILHAESMILSAHAESIILSALLWACAENISAH
jgi:hypothetical protein